VILRVGFFFWAVSIWKVIRRLCIPYVSLVGQSSCRPVSILENIQTKGSSLGPTFGLGPTPRVGMICSIRKYMQQNTLQKTPRQIKGSNLFVDFFPLNNL